MTHPILTLMKSILFQILDHRPAIVMENQTLLNGTLVDCFVEYDITFIKVCYNTGTESSIIRDILIAR